MAEELILKEIKEIKANAAKHNEDDDVRFEKNDRQNIAILKSIDQLVASHSALVTSQNDFHEKMQPMALWFNDMTFTKRIKWEWITSGTKIGGFIAVSIVVMGALWTAVRWIISQALIK